MKLGFCFYINVIAGTDVSILNIIYSLQNGDGGLMIPPLSQLPPERGAVTHRSEGRACPLPAAGV